MGVVYCLHFSRPLAHARHYVGYTDDLESRLAAHAAGRGARLMEVIRGAGITFRLARTWEGDRKLERKLKRRGGHARICPLCRGNAPQED